MGRFNGIVAISLLAALALCLFVALLGCLVWHVVFSGAPSFGLVFDCSFAVNGHFLSSRRIFGT